MPGYRFNKWPFRDGEVARLHWVASPFRGKAGNYLVEIVFCTKTGFHNIYRPWGDLPFFKMGYNYQNGRKTEIDNTLKRFRLPVNKIGNATIANSYDCIPKSLYSFSEYKIKDGDQCDYFVVDGIRYIIPCVEIVRAITGTSPFFVNTLLSSSYLSDFSEYDIRGKVLHIDLSDTQPNKFPTALITKFGIREYANFLLNPQLRDWRNSVKTDFLFHSNQNHTAKIKAFIPNIKDSFIDGWGIKQNSNVLLLHIEVKNLPNLPYNIEVTRLVHNPSLGSSPTTGNSSVYNTSIGDILLQDDGNANTSSTQVNISAFPDRYLFEPEVTFLRKELKGESVKKIRVISSDSAQEGSAQQHILGGKYKGVEAQPSPDFTVSLPPHFKLLQKALQILVQNGSLKITHTMVDKKSNDYVIVLGTTIRGNHAAILEFRQTDEKNISTLIITSTADCEIEVTKQLWKIESGNGHWNKDDLQNEAPFHDYLLKHYINRTPQKLAELLSKYIFC